MPGTLKQVFDAILNSRLDDPVKTLGGALAPGYTVATLPAGTTGQRAYVTNALAPVFGAAVAGGGAVVVPVYYTGAAWFVG